MKTNYQPIHFNTQGRYAILGNLSSDTSKLLFVFHGQGQLAHYFIQKFKPLVKQGYAIIAPEGLHNYYLQGFSGRVGASWMTSENRLVAIKNYINFLNSVYNDVRTKISNETKIHLLGFSQGTATVSRWVAQNSFDFEQLILWSGALPPDLNKELIFNRMKGKPLLQVVGNNDPYITPAHKKEINKRIKKYKLSASINYYKGGHEIEPNTLLELL